MTQTLKSIYAFFAGIVTVVVAFFLINSNKKKTKVAETDKQISTNKSDADKAQGHIDQIKDEKRDVKNTVKTRENNIKDLKNKAVKVKPVATTDVAAAKENIIKKTKRRGRKPNTKKS